MDAQHDDVSDIALFALGSSRPFGERIAQALGLVLARHEERVFEDGEESCRPLSGVRGRDACVVASLYDEPEQSVHDKLCRLLFFCATLRTAGAERVSALVPYLCYGRQDQRSAPRDPVASACLARLLEAAGCDRVIALDVHNLAAYQNAFRCRADHLSACRLFARYFAPLLRVEPVVVVSPDLGGVKRAERFRQTLAVELGREVGLGMLEKQRSGDRLSGHAVVGELAGKNVILFDDMISSGDTLERAARMCRDAGAGKLYAAASHGLLVGAAGTRLAACGLEQLAITDSVAVPSERSAPLTGRLAVLAAAPLFAAALRVIHNGGADSDFLDD